MQNKVLDLAEARAAEVRFGEFGALWQAVRGALEHQWEAPESARRLCRELYRGLVCKSTVAEPLDLSVPPRVDHAWHLAILETQLYREMCQAAFGRFLEHTTTTSADPVAQKNARVDATVAIYAKLFGEEPPADLWEREQDFGNPEAATKRQKGSP